MILHTRPTSSQAHGGFTLIELLVVVAIISLLVSILLPSLGRAKELANRVYCVSNLHQLGTSMLVYSQEFDSYPVSSPPAFPNNYYNSFATVASGGKSGESLAPVVSQKQGVPFASLWILTLRGQAPPKMFLCKSDRFIVSPASVVGKEGDFFDNFQDQYQISYSIAYPWQGNSTSRDWRPSASSLSALASDMAPLSGSNGKNVAVPKGKTRTAFNSSNHNDAGQNVLFGDYHGEWTDNPYMGFTGGDNIFTTGSGDYQISPSLNSLGTDPDSGDIVMVPVRDAWTGDLGN